MEVALSELEESSVLVILVILSVLDVIVEVVVVVDMVVVVDVVVVLDVVDGVVNISHTSISKQTVSIIQSL